MIVYSATKKDFQQDIIGSAIEDKIESLLFQKTKTKVGPGEVRSWKNSLQYMDRVIADEAIPGDSSVAIEFCVPLTNKRIDFILAGQNKEKRDAVVIVELKQWEEMTLSKKDAIVETYLNGHIQEKEHPSYQAWTYAELLQNYNSVLQDGTVDLKPCAYLHNCKDSHVVRHNFYSNYLEKAPAYIRSEGVKLRDFIKNNVVYGDKNDVLYKIEHGKLRPSKKLSDSLSRMMSGNQEFIMIDEQKVVFENVMHALREKGSVGKKKVIVVQGGPGTGKSVVAVNLLVAANKEKYLSQYVTKNAAPRAVYEAKLTGSFKKSFISNLFKGSGGFQSQAEDTFDLLIVDEAHRLNEKSGLFKNLGENQIKEIIASSAVSVFFVDNDQVVTLSDIGESHEIIRWAEDLGAEIEEFKLESQFRCNGSDSYLIWLDNMLSINSTSNFKISADMYDFRVLDSPVQLKSLIEKRNLESNSARMVAGYCWDWQSKKDETAYDIEFEKHGFRAKWNLTDDGSAWMIKPNSVNEVGCIHTSQGLELDYIGVIIGPDLLVRDGVVLTYPENRSKNDRSIHGWKTKVKKCPAETRERLDKIIKNTYKTLMTRGQKGCYIYSSDAETAEYFKSWIESGGADEDSVVTPQGAIEFLEHEEVKPYEDAIPVFDLQAAAGAFSHLQSPEVSKWVRLPEPHQAQPGYFICQVIGESMNKRIPNGAWCLFKEYTGGSRNGMIVLAEYLNETDPDSGGHYTVKQYFSEKAVTEDTWAHERIVLKPNSFFSPYADINISPADAEHLKIIGEFKGVVEF